MQDNRRDAHSEALAAMRRSQSELEAERGSRDPSHLNSQISILAAEQKVVEYAEAAHGNQRGDYYLHAATMCPKN